MLLLVRRSITRTSHNTRARHFEHCTTHEGTSSAMCTLVTKDARRPVGSGSVCKEESRNHGPKSDAFSHVHMDQPQACLAGAARLLRRSPPTLADAPQASWVRAAAAPRAKAAMPQKMHRDAFDTETCVSRQTPRTARDPRNQNPAQGRACGPVAGVAVTRERQRCTKFLAPTVFCTHAEGQGAKIVCMRAARRVRTHTRTTKTKAYVARGDMDSLCFMTLLWATCGRTRLP
jgi:hypothetical protein